MLCFSCAFILAVKTYFDEIFCLTFLFIHSSALFCNSFVKRSTFNVLTLAFQSKNTEQHRTRVIG